ncbi:hypothetical protein [Kocuria rosea]|uniref:hypothetical protein n=1 Tax=Kocuria rosea TaxID=1275 RepID=UPI0021B5D944|nr:hypothetical protein [Kocuria rosea]
MSEDGAIHQMHPIATLTLGPQSGSVTDRIRRIHQELSVPGIEATISEDVLAAMWHK